jgi:hypothetical protein
MHYERWRAHGDPLICLVSVPPRGEPKRYLCEVVLAYEGDECLIWPFGTNEHGYGVLTSLGGSRIVARHVCEEVNGPPPTPEHEAAHSCGKGRLACVTKRHLSWKTSAGNKADMVEHGTRLRGERSGLSKLTEPEVRQIIALKGIKSQSKIADQFGVSQRHVGRIHRHENWAWLE